MLDYAVIVPRLQPLYEWSADELADPRVLGLVRDGNPIYAWPFEERHGVALAAHAVSSPRARTCDTPVDTDARVLRVTCLAGRMAPALVGPQACLPGGWVVAGLRPSQSLGRHLATAMRSLKTPCPASCGPAPGPVMVPLRSSLPGTPRRWWPPRQSPADPRARRARAPRERSHRAPPGSENSSVATCFRRPTPGRRGQTPVERCRRSAAGDLFESKLPAEYKPRQDHHLRHRVMALDICSRVALRPGPPLAPRRVRPRRSCPHSSERG